MVKRLRLALLLALAVPAIVPAAAPAVETGMVLGARPTGETVDQVDRASAAGAQWLRVFVDWSTAEKSQGHLDEFYLREFDARIAKATGAGMKVVMVVTRSPRWASGSAEPNQPPADPATYASFLRRYAERYRGRVSAWEVWNEPDETAFWKPTPSPTRYAALLKAAYPAVKAGDPGATVVLGGLTGNNYRFLERVYAAGGRGSFDAVGVHTDTACLTSPPEEQYREPDGRIGRFSFTGYREVRRSILANGDDKPIWMTELGWSTLTSTCQVGSRAGTKPSGVSEATQAAYLQRAYRCLQRDSYVAVGIWFSIQDIQRDTTDYDHKLGLLRDNGSAKPAYGEFRDFARASPRPSERCGALVDASAPVVKILKPTADQEYIDKLDISARATDDQGVLRMELYADGKRIRISSRSGRMEAIWHRASSLSIGRHTITVRARDAGGNVGTASVAVVRVRPHQLKVPPATFEFGARRLSGRRVRITGRVSAPGSPVKPRGRVRVFLDIRRGKIWRKYSSYNKSVRRPFAFTARVRRPGRWRVRAVYVAKAPFRSVRAPHQELGRFR